MSVCECHFLLVCVFLFYKMCIDRCVCVCVGQCHTTDLIICRYKAVVISEQVK